MIKKSLASIAAGALLVGGGALATAQADPAQPDNNTTAAAPVERSATARTTVARAAYPASVFTRARVNVPERVRVGNHPRVHVTVTAGAVRRKPHGTVRVVVAGKARHADVRRGEAVVRLPRLRAGRAYTARAYYKPTRGSQFKKDSGKDRFRVVRRSR